jgi:predicted Fe-Mo cluster-binding NifX family protein
MKILVTVWGDFVAPRFDMSSEVIIAPCYDRQFLDEPRSIILSNVSGELICDLVLKENIDVLVCGGIEEQHYQFLVWKKVRVFDSIIGPWSRALELAVKNSLTSDIILPATLAHGVKR